MGEIERDNNAQELGQDEKQLVNIFRNIPDDEISRRDFLKFCAIVATGFAMSACSPDSPVPVALVEQPEQPEDGVETGDIILENPIRLNTNYFVQDVPNYPNAISERSPFATNGNGEALNLRYGGIPFPEVTYLHYTGVKPPVVGEIIPLMYKLPQYTSEKKVQIAPYAISTQYKIEQYDLNNGMNHYVVPIVTTGTDSGIIARDTNSSHTPFEVKADSFSGNNKGFFAWALLKEIGNELVVVGVTKRAHIYINANSVPEEISSIVNE